MKHVLCLLGFHRLIEDAAYLTTSRLHCERCNAEFIDSLFGLFKMTLKGRREHEMGGTVHGGPHGADIVPDCQAVVRGGASMSEVRRYVPIGEMERDDENGDWVKLGSLEAVEAAAKVLHNEVARLRGALQAIATWDARSTSQRIQTFAKAAITPQAGKGGAE